MPVIRYLEIGVFEGRGALLMLESYPQLIYTGIDSWKIKDAPVAIADLEEVQVVEKRARENLKPYQDRASLIKGGSAISLMHLFQKVSDGNQSRYNAIYIDAGHHAMDVLLESALCWLMLEVGGVMVWDDYQDRGVRRSVRTGGDAFLQCVKGHYASLFENWQLGIQKTGEADCQASFRELKGLAIT